MLHIKQNFALMFARMDFKLLISALQNFTWYFSTKTKRHYKLRHTHDEMMAVKFSSALDAQKT